VIREILRDCSRSVVLFIIVKLCSFWLILLLFLRVCNTVDVLYCRTFVFDVSIANNCHFSFIMPVERLAAPLIFEKVRLNNYRSPMPKKWKSGASTRGLSHYTDLMSKYTTMIAHKVKELEHSLLMVTHF